MNDNLHPQPQIENWMKDSDVDLRKNADDIINSILSLNNIHANDIQYYSGGASSLVALVSRENLSNLVVKVVDNKYYEEEFFFSQTKEKGFPTIPVHGSGVVGDYHYLIMDQINSPLLGQIDIQLALERKLYWQFGKTIAEINTIRTSGFGDIREGKGRYYSWDAFMEKSYLSQYISSEIYKATGIEIPVREFEILRRHVDDNGAFLGHGDLNTDNAFVTDNEEILLFDSFPSSTFQLMDLGLFLTYTYRESGEMYQEVRNQFIEGYRSIIDINDELINAAITVNCYRKILTAVRKKNEPRLKSYLELFGKTKQPN